MVYLDFPSQQWYIWITLPQWTLHTQISLHLAPHMVFAWVHLSLTLSFAPSVEMMQNLCNGTDESFNF